MTNRIKKIKINIQCVNSIKILQQVNNHVPIGYGISTFERKRKELWKHYSRHKISTKTCRSYQQNLSEKLQCLARDRKKRKNAVMSGSNLQLHSPSPPYPCDSPCLKPFFSRRKQKRG